MKNLITMIGMGALLCVVPSCKKSSIIPREASESRSVNNSSLQRAPEQPLAMDMNSTTLHVILGSKACSDPQKQFTSLLLNIKDIEVYTEGFGWQKLPAISNSYDVVAMQHIDMIGLNITEGVRVHPGTISKVAISFGENNQLKVNDRQVCFALSTPRVMMDVKGEVKIDAINELLLDMDICGNIGTQGNGENNACYVLQPVVNFWGVTQKKFE